ncbi:MAG: ABC transporter permease [Candidatus Marinimicrobia bacterium]|jgi:lipoprotein-releasing system permease protein|nr:ABC transporter permease [Candidatus Neomarinimicrobiota bacterium]|tara:strand:+ start:2474 stop:3670 length:1197 start_codon:yes stop_codon:yes gene_type:complete
MNFPFYLSTRYLRTAQKGSFTRVAGVLSVAGLSVGISALLITLFILNGFEKVISKKIADFDGHIRVKHYLNYPIPSEILEMDSILFHYKETVSQSRFIQKPALLRKGKVAEGIIVEGIEPDRVEFINDILVSGRNDISGNQIVIGERLANQVNISIGDKIVLFDLATLNGSNKRLKQFVVAGFFHSGMLEYDNHMIYMNLEQADRLFHMNEKVSGQILRLSEAKWANELSEFLKKDLAYPYMVMTWKEKNRSLFKWMNIQRWPILFIFSLIAMVGLVNIISALAMIVLDKTRQIGILKSLGVSHTGLRQLFLFYGFMIGLAGAIIGSFLALILAWMQNNFKIITLPEDIYFMDFIPMDVSIFDVFSIAIISIVCAIFAAIWPTVRAERIEPADALRYE